MCHEVLAAKHSLKCAGLWKYRIEWIPLLSVKMIKMEMATWKAWETWCVENVMCDKGNANHFQKLQTSGHTEVIIQPSGTNWNQVSYRKLTQLE